MEDYYEDGTKTHALWDTSGCATTDEKLLPRLAASPTIVSEWASAQGRTCNDLRAFIENYCSDKAQDFDCPHETEWGLLLEWAITAGQCDPQAKENSILAFQVTSFTCVDPEVQD